MSQATINRYQAGGDYYVQLQAQYGTASADAIAAAAATGDVTQLNYALANASGAGPAQSTNTLGIFANQLLTDPLAAPAASLNNQLGLAFQNLFKSPAILAVVGIGLFIFLGGLDWLKGKLKK